MSSDFSSQRAALRRELRAKRRALSADEQQQAAEQLLAQLCALPALQQAKRIAFYWPADGEIDPRLLADCALFLGCTFYLPVLENAPENTLRFVAWQKGDALCANRFGIPEPVAGERVAASDLDVLLLPLSGFDAAGNRLGMGGGFYDRTLAAVPRASAKPVLIGVAHACQELPHVPVEEWDVPLHMVVTDQRVFVC